MDKNIFNIFFFIEREHKVGHKEVDNLLPFFYFLSKIKDIKFSARGIIYGYQSILSVNSDPRIKLLTNIKNLNLIDPYKISSWFIKYVKKLKQKAEGRIRTIIVKILCSFVLIKYKNIDNEIKWEEIVGEEFMMSKTPIILSLNLTYSIKEAVLKIKKLNPRAKWVVIPHGTTLSDNNMLFDTDLNRDDIIQNNPLFNDVDYYLRTSRRDLNDSIRYGFSENKGFIIGSHRFCTEWLIKKKELKLDELLPRTREDAKVKILFLIPKPFINIFHEELVRTIDFISRYDEIDLIINRISYSYPKLSKNILNRFNVYDCIISKEYQTGALIDWADIVIHVGTGVIFEAFMKNKITVFPRYLTCNTLISEKYNAGWNLKNRDELRELCNIAIESIKNTRDKYFKEHEKFNKKFINDFVNGGTKSVPENISSAFKKILKDMNK